MSKVNRKICDIHPVETQPQYVTYARGSFAVFPPLPGGDTWMVGEDGPWNYYRDVKGFDNEQSAVKWIDAQMG